MKKILILFLLFILIISCEKKKKEDILIKIDDVEITADQFKYSFEFAIAPTKIGPNPRRFYLNYLLKELILAREGYAQGYNKNPYVTNRVAQRRYDDLLEAFIDKHVRKRVKISDDELEDAVKKGSVKFQMIVLPLPSENKAEQVYLEASKTNLEDYIEKQLEKQEVPLANKKFYETEWMDYLSIPPDIFNEVKNLEIGKVSKPLPYGDGYALFQVLGIHREGITTDDLKYGRRRKMMEKRLYNIKADKLIHHLMDSLLTPMDVTVRGEIVTQLTPLLYEWYQDGIKKKESINEMITNAPDTAKSYFVGLRSLQDETLVTYNGGEIKVRDYFDFMNYNRRNLHESKSIEDFQKRLIGEIGRMMKNREFIKIAIKDGYPDSTRIKRDLKIWEQKWTFEIFRYNLTKNITVSEDEMRDFFKHRWRELEIAGIDTTRFYKYENAVYNAVLHEKYVAVLDSAVEVYKKKYPVYVNYKLLDQLELQDDPKSIRTTLIVRKNFNWDQSVPVVDFKWFSF